MGRGGINGHRFEKGGSIVDESIVVEPLFFEVSFGIVEAGPMRRSRVAGLTVSEMWWRAVVAALSGTRWKPPQRGATDEPPEGRARSASMRIASNVGRHA